MNAHRVAAQQGVGASTTVKTLVTAAALAATARARVLGKKVEPASSAGPQDAEEVAQHPIDLDSAQRQPAVAQWAVPALTGCLVLLNALHGEQQRPEGRLPGRWEAGPLRRHPLRPAALLKELLAPGAERRPARNRAPAVSPTGKRPC